MNQCDSFSRVVLCDISGRKPLEHCSGQIVIVLSMCKCAGWEREEFVSIHGAEKINENYDFT